MAHDRAIQQARELIRQKKFKEAVAVYERRIIELTAMLEASGHTPTREPSFSKRLGRAAIGVLLVIVLLLLVLYGREMLQDFQGLP